MFRYGSHAHHAWAVSDAATATATTEEVILATTVAAEMTLATAVAAADGTIDIPTAEVSSLVTTGHPGSGSTVLVATATGAGVTDMEALCRYSNNTIVQVV